LPVIQEGRVSRWTINDWARKGKFGEDMSKPGRVRWFRHDAFERLMAREAQQPKGVS
jgi:predicted site-specific integrase-resolvase